MTDSHNDGVVVVGAGPYGLAAVAHLREGGAEPAVFGDPMSYWERRMPAGMLLRSSWRASSISSPGGLLSLAAFERSRGAALERPVPRDDFLAYGHWFQRRAVPSLDRRRVTAVRRSRGAFAVELSDGASLRARRVVVATGLDRFAWRPPEFARLPPEIASHTADHAEHTAFARRRLLVVGAGQSALESAALAREAGADVRLLVRHPVHWLTRSARLHGARRALASTLYAPHDVGPAGLSWVVSAPSLMRRVPVRTRARMTRRCIRPAAADWLGPRLDGVEVVTGRPLSATAAGDEAVVRLDDGRVLRADHLLLGTGFRPDVRRLAPLAPELAGAVRAVDGSPVLGPGFETSVPGLHVLGALAAHSFGPLMRFVSGTWYAAPALARAVGAGRRGA